ncbi:hypothetical protein CC1G_10342 [Coprinopsis cinerea okayama7|uniref:SnoaL-like domain-containing protein n=1 Tax=Coprinopsis cinerea (strain Okayama-7 / 130 / ATCC MYA-4618 / FGSC 9003) TaxID=240176 RepID=A8P0L6_COPC7|nr:hypothetical protein CC1G_10342 [Coprinopsis cinerea okayama7\|eukprot:XP_001837921.2 hypothetical protein CC1G_10342 [Coprinopsis cinerea okayama7\
MKFADTLQITTDSQRVPPQLAKEIFTKILTAEESKDTNNLLSFTEDGATYEVSGLDRVSGKAAIKQYHDWMFAAVERTEIVMKSGRLGPTESSATYDQTYYYTDGTSSTVSWTLTVQNNPDIGNIKASAIKIVGNATAHWDKCTALVGPLPVSPAHRELV